MVLGRWLKSLLQEERVKTRCSLPGLYKALQDAEENVCVETPLVSLIQDNHRVCLELWVVQHLSQKGAICISTILNHNTSMA